MADRTVTIRLEAKDELTPALKSASEAASGLSRELAKDSSGSQARTAKAIADVGKSASTSAKEIGDFLTYGAQVTNISGSAEKAAAAWAKVGTNLDNVKKTGKELSVAFGAVGLAFGVALKPVADFDRAMSQMKAGTGATGTELAKLRAAALDLSNAKLGYTATEAANGITELGKAGVSTKDILGGGLKGALSLAASGQLQVGDAAEIAASAMNQFGLKGKDVGHIADLLSAGAAKAQGSVKDLSMGLAQAGLVAHGTGLSIEETVGGLAAFASAGLMGSDAGTSFKSMLQALNNPSKEAATTMKDLGINAFDAQGKFVGLAPLAEQLKTKMAGLSDEQRNAAMATIFGADAVRAANVLYQQGGAGIENWTRQVNDSGHAMRTAATLTDNLQGDLSKLRATVENTLIQTGTGANDSMRTLVQTLTGVVEMVKDIPAPLLAAGAGFAALATVGTKLTAFGQAVGVEFRNVKNAIQESASAAEASGSRYSGAVGAMSGLKMGAQGLLSVLGGPWGIALAAATAAVGYFGQKKQEAAAQMQTFMSAIEADSGALGDNARAAIANKLEQDGLLQKFEEMGVKSSTVVSAVMGISGAQEEVERALQRTTAAQAGQNVVVDEFGRTTDVASTATGVYRGNLEELRGQLTQAQDAQRRKTEATQAATAATDADTGTTKTATGATGEHTNATQLSTKALQENAKAVEETTKQVKGFSSALLQARGDEVAYQAAVDNATESVKKNGATLDINTKAGRENRTALDAVASSALSMTESMIKNHASVEQVSASMEKARAEFIDAARKMGMSESAANALANQLGLTSGRVGELTRQVNAIPTSHNTTITADASQALAAARNFQDVLGMIRDKTVTVRQVVETYGNIAGVTGRGGLVQADGGVVEYYARGGLREKHIAQIAKAGSWRVWAEPETGGEAYIPLARAKRARSEAILEEVARRFGYSLTRFAEGGIVGGYAGSYSAPNVAVAAPTVNVAAPDAPIVNVLIDGQDLRQLARDEAGAALGAILTQASTVGRWRS